MPENFTELALKPELVTALKKENITTPTDIQQRAIPEALLNKDMIAQSGTGTGKTLAYLLPLYHKLKPDTKEIQAIILCPTHELTMQILRQIERLSKNSAINLTATSIIGNVNIDRQIEKLKTKPNIIVGTPGRILELIQKRKLAAHTVKTIIIDEADRLMDKSNSEFVNAIVKSTLKERQVLALSATIPQQLEDSIKAIMKEPQVIRIEENMAIPDNISHMYFLAEQRDKIDVLRKLIRILEPQKAIAFLSNQGNEIEIFTSKLQYKGIDAVGIHGTSQKSDRKKAMEGFITGKTQLLVASDIAARGLHIEGVTHVFNINIPEDIKAYVHRAGRAARVGGQGTAISIVTERELKFLKTFEKQLGINIENKEMYCGEIVDGRKNSSKIRTTNNNGAKNTTELVSKQDNEEDYKPVKSKTSMPKASSKPTSAKRASRFSKDSKPSTASGPRSANTASRFSKDSKPSTASGPSSAKRASGFSKDSKPSTASGPRSAKPASRFSKDNKPSTTSGSRSAKPTSRFSKVDKSSKPK